MIVLLVLTYILMASVSRKYLKQRYEMRLTSPLSAQVYYGNIWRGKDFPFMSQTIFMANGR